MSPVIKVAQKKDVPAGRGIQVEADGKKMALFYVDGQYYCIDDTCTHAGGSLSEGPLDGKVVVCPWHGAAFDITDGSVKESPAEENVNSYPVVVEGEDIKIKLP